MSEPQVQCVAFGQTVFASMHFGGEVVLRDVKSGKELRKLDGAMFPHDLTLSPNGRYLAAGGIATFKMWDVTTKRLVLSLEGETLASGAIAFRPDSQVVAVVLKRAAITLLSID
jgi:WD40 repeat protein